MHQGQQQLSRLDSILQSCLVSSQRYCSRPGQPSVLYTALSRVMLCLYCRLSTCTPSHEPRKIKASLSPPQATSKQGGTA